MRELNRLKKSVETLRHALDSLMVVVPEWTRAHSQPEWLERYGSRVQNYRLPRSQTQQDAEHRWDQQALHPLQQILSAGFHHILDKNHIAWIEREDQRGVKQYQQKDRADPQLIQIIATDRRYQLSPRENLVNQPNYPGWK